MESNSQSESLELGKDEGTSKSESTGNDSDCANQDASSRNCAPFELKTNISTRYSSSDDLKEENPSFLQNKTCAMYQKEYRQRLEEENTTAPTQKSDERKIRKAANSRAYRERKRRLREAAGVLTQTRRLTQIEKSVYQKLRKAANSKAYRERKKRLGEEGCLTQTLRSTQIQKSDMEKIRNASNPKTYRERNAANSKAYRERKKRLIEEGVWTPKYCTESSVLQSQRENTFEIVETLIHEVRTPGPKENEQRIKMNNPVSRIEQQRKNMATLQDNSCTNSSHAVSTNSFKNNELVTIKKEIIDDVMNSEMPLDVQSNSQNYEETHLTLTIVKEEKIDSDVQIDVPINIAIENGINRNIVHEEVTIKFEDEDITEDSILPTIKSEPNELIDIEVEGLNNTSQEILPTISYSSPNLHTTEDAYHLLEVTDKSATEYTCNKCFMTFQKEPTFSRHIKWHQRNEQRELGIKRRLKTLAERRLKKGIFPCEYCPKKFKYEAAFQRHVNSFHGVEVEVEEEKEFVTYPCICGKIFTRKSRMDTCRKSHMVERKKDLPSRCSNCNHYFGNYAMLKQHRKLAHPPKVFLCKFCPMDYLSPKELFKHLKIHQKVQLIEYKFVTEIVDGKQDLKCFICKKISTEPNELKSHVFNDHKEPYSCMDCDESFPNITDFVTHTKSSHLDNQNTMIELFEAYSLLIDTWKCDYCNVQFENPDQIAQHFLDHKFKNAIGPILLKTSEAPVRCEDCRRLFLTQLLLRRHVRLYHDPNVSEVVRTLNQTLVCVHCRKSCKDETGLNSHMRLHSMDRQYPCMFCDFRFSTIHRRKAHESIHTGDLKFVCFICEYRCGSQNRLNCHKNTAKHINMKNSLMDNVIQAPPPIPVTETVIIPLEATNVTDSETTCDVCNEKFATNDEMVEHKKSHPFITVLEDNQSKIFFK